MKSTELRIGNLFDKNGNVDTVTPNEIEALFESESREWVKPIPLTEEWLLKFDFRFNDLGFEDLSISFGLISKDFHFVIGNYYVPLKHVHQLQNLYHAITRTELQIKEI